MRLAMRIQEQDILKRKVSCGIWEQNCMKCGAD